MFTSKKLTLVFGFFVIASMILAACQPAATATPAEVVRTVVVTQLVQGTPVEVVQVVTPTPEPTGPRTLVICMGQEPDTMYPYGGAMLAKTSILESIYDGAAGMGIDNNSYAYQPVILEKLPSLEDGDAVLNSVTVSEGDTITDANQEVVTLESGVMYVPAGETEAVEYTGGDVQVDQMVVTFKLLPGLMWSDGTPLTAQDSVYAFNLVSDPDTDQPKFGIQHTASYEATDDLTAVWTGLPGFKDATYFINWGVAYGAAPEHIWGQYTAAELNEADVSARLPVGWGPYIIDEWVQGDHISLHKNPNYFRADEGLPKFENLVFRFIGENSNAAIAAVLAGECDIIDQTAGLDDQSELLLELQGAGQINPTFVTGTTWEHVDFGIQRIEYDDGYQQGTDRPDFFSDVRVRQAFTMCMDRQSMVDAAFFGQSIVIDNYIPPQHPLYNTDVKHYDFDVAAASALLEEVGWTDPDGDPATPRVAQGVAGVPDGTELTVAYETTDATLRQQITQILQQSMAQCGINAQLQYYPASEWFADGPEGKLFGRRFDLGQFAWLTGVQPPCDLYKTDGVPGPEDGTWTSIMNPDAGDLPFPFGWGGQNDPGYSNPTYDAACNKGLTALPGQPAYEEGHKEAQAIFAEDLPVAPLALRLKLAASRPDMCNFIMDPTNNSEMWNIEEFDYGEGCQ
jgi:peptide/nickel transport system substrate-binding protein